MKYNKDFLESTILLLEEQLDDLDSWSVYNQDKYNEQVGKIRGVVEELKNLEQIQSDIKGDNE